MKSWRSFQALQCVVTAIFLGLISTGEGFKQELWLYDDAGFALYITMKVPDLSPYSWFLPTVVRSCTFGAWHAFDEVNYEGSWPHLMGDGRFSSQYCQQTNASNFKSLRYGGGNDTSVPAISLYAGENINGEEVLVTEIAQMNISIPIQSVTSTGPSTWSLFEGPNFDGKACCLPAPEPEACDSGSFYGGGTVQSFNLTTVGSVLRGCDTPLPPCRGLSCPPWP